MNLFNILFLFSLLREISGHNLENILDSNVNFDFLRVALNITNNLNVILNNLTLNFSCNQHLYNTYHNKFNKIERLYQGSSRGFVDLNSFYNCVNDEKENNTFFLIYPLYTSEAHKNISKLDNFSIEQNLWIFGVCLGYDLCSEQDIKEIFDAINIKSGNIFKIYNKSNIIVVDSKNKKKEIQKMDYLLPRCIPIIFFLMQFIFIIFKIIPVKIFGCCLKRKYMEATKRTQSKFDILINNNSFEKQISLKIRKCFSCSEISEDLTNSKKNELFRNEDMTYIKGMKGLGYIFFIFGINYIILYNHPLCKSENKSRENYIKFGIFFILFIFFRFGPALILSTSGYSLSYKFLNFLDQKLINDDINEKQTKTKSKKNNTITDETEENEDDKHKKELDNILIPEKTETKRADDIKKNNNLASNSEDSNNTSENLSYYENTLGVKFYDKDISNIKLDALFKGQTVDENLILSGISVNNVSYYLFFNFVMRQFHKFILIPLGILIFKYSFPVLSALSGYPLMLLIYKEFFENLGTSFGNYLYYGSFMDLFKEDSKDINMMQLFSIPMCEFNFFIVCSIIIFVCYKKKRRLDNLIIVLIFLFFSFKIIYVLTNIESNNPGMFYTDSKFQRFFFNPVFNFDFYLIGMLFGIVNYVIQNELEKKESLVNQRPFVRIPIKICRISDYQKNKNIIHFIFAIIFLILALIGMPIYFSKYFESIITNNDPGYIFSIISILDIEVFIYCFHFIAISCYVSGKNMFFHFLNANIFSYSHKIGIWVGVCTPTLTYILLYLNEASFNLNFFTAIINGAIILTNTILFSFIFSFVMEMPYKKYIKLYFNISNELNKTIIGDDSERRSTSGSIQELVESDQKSIDEKSDLVDDI